MTGKNQQIISSALIVISSALIGINATFIIISSGKLRINSNKLRIWYTNKSKRKQKKIFKRNIFKENGGGDAHIRVRTRGNTTTATNEKFED
ncbi:hypothetical protein [Muribaculum intestinale]|uniref:Uncharacterized protein n=1 Tax=Muribaculum intestinale TaxID=1796646 RepID=A0A4S2FRC5_9BACT|nr:hypothetical protein [Muribaculum intestinale]MYM13343.1 hypothetical protein [Muribaculum intestinale]TGY71723.1 hypothetical protein E5333_11110 [Muribaculum intestinale]